MASKGDLFSTRFVEDVTRRNAHLNFVQRYMEPEKWPSIPAPNGRDVMTHMMAWGEDDQGAYVYPTIIYDPMTKQLKQLSGKEADRYAHMTGEMIRFDEPWQADAFSVLYKRASRKK